MSPDGNTLHLDGIMAGSNGNIDAADGIMPTSDGNNYYFCLKLL